MDTSASDIFFDDDGVCNYCTEFLERSGHIVFKDPAVREHELIQFVERVKADGRGKRYDCVIGVSGGVDSSWALVQAVKLGLRPLAVHMDNGWNSELAQNNIANLVRRLGVDLYTHVIDWHEYKNLMQAFFEAHVIDVELLYDNAMLAVNYKMASKYKLHNILSGTNQATEGLRIPKAWNWLKYDKKNIKALSSKFTNQNIVTFPAIGTLDFIYYEYIKKIKWISFLDYFEYNKFEVLDKLENNYSYKRYPYKHYESVFTRFYQGYILPKKFNVDKRRPHLSVLIVSGQMSRDEALIQLESIPYPSIHELEEDIRYFLIKMGWSRQQLDGYIDAVEIKHDHYESEIKLWNFAVKVYKLLRR
jgi:N-acetyl sugar amidotransferase